MLSDLNKPYIVAEISANHNGSLERAKLIMQSAAANGASCVKLQTYTPDTMTIKSERDEFFIKSGLWKGYTLWDLYKNAHTPYEWHAELFNYAKELNIDCFSTPFDETAVDLLEKLHCPFYKIASFELTDLPLIKYIAETGKPVVFSTGMANKKEIDDAVDILTKYGSGDYAILHCISGYPTPIDEINLETISFLKDEYDCEIGISDHTKGTLVSTLSITYGVKIIERHFTLNRLDKSPDSEFSLEPSELKKLSSDVQSAFLSRGNKKIQISEIEKENVKFRRSIYAVQGIKKGEKFTTTNIRRIRPNFGLEPRYYPQIIDTCAQADIEKGEPIRLEHTFLNKE